MNMADFAWVLLFLPLAIAAVNWFAFAHRDSLAALTGTLGVAVTFAVSLMFALGGASGAEPGSFTWIPISGDEGISIGLTLDDLAARMMVVVTGIGLLVHVFSWGYMKGEEGIGRYFAGLSIFMFSMTGIVLASNLAMTFIFWELVGFSSYLLIGHWYKKPSAADAAKKAFITNRVGDFGFLAGILLTWGVFGTLNFADMHIDLSGVSSCVLTATILCLFCGAVGKSAQFPLHVWLPDAMEGPTPVSALIHAATMVAAGVYMLVRLQVSMGAGAFTECAGQVIAFIGAATAVLAAFMAIQQDDIKRVLAYSTLSQLGYMVMAVGLCAGEAAMFHLYTHAWFKALLFLGAGAVIVSCHHEQNIWQMGGLSRRMKMTTLCFLLGTAALIAIPGTSGFFSKEAILDAALEKNPVYFWVGAGVALLTTFYMTRLVLVAFCGKARSEKAEHASEAGFSMVLPLVVLAVMAVISGYGFLADELTPYDGFNAHGFAIGLPFYVSLGALALGLIGAFAFYGRNPGKDALSGNCLSRALANRLYIDKFYDRVLINGVQKWFACLIDFLDQFIIGGVIVLGIARLVSGIGGMLRCLQAGSLRGYAYMMALGLLFFIFFLAIYIF